MGLRKGQTNNKAGKPAGTLNKMSKELRLQISEFLEENFPKVITEFNSLKGRDKVKLYTDLLPYCLPRLQTTEITGIDGKDLLSSIVMTKEEIKKISDQLESEC